eukprot:Amastigsp_a843791_816.p1 type:complete len:340 gc:universal Amastigsp_a843791_816:37-1056(+)
MRPIMLQGHTRALTHICYSRESDLIFSTAKDHNPMVWFADNGERLGTYQGHTGAVWYCAVDSNTERLLTGSADNTAKLWDVRSGANLFSWTFQTIVRVAEWAEGNAMALFVTDHLMGFQGTLQVFRIAEDPARQETEPKARVDLGMHCRAARWGPLNERIYCGMDNGTIRIYDGETLALLQTVEGEHTKTIMDLQFSPDGMSFITASKDKCAKLWDARGPTVVRTFPSEVPVNSASMSTLYDHVVVAGGQDAQTVTTTAVQSGRFQARFFHSTFEEELGGVTGHFGPINYISFAPDGKGFASGGEDGYVRIHHFDPSYHQQATDFAALEERAMTGEFTS